MFKATGEMVFFGDVTIVVPEQWACQEVKPTLYSYTWDSAHLRVGQSHYLFGDNPWTQQLGGCGEPGDWIYFSEKFLENDSPINNRGNILVHEWAKYRWGVFEEYGHDHDQIFPSVYRDQNNTMKPTYCTDQPLGGTMYCPEGGTEAECQFTPDLTQNNTITSSLLAAPFLDSVTDFCNDKSHNAAAPTKHNLLCDQTSTKEIINRHTDMMGNPLSLENTNFTVVRATGNWPRMVLLVEYTPVMAYNQNRVVGGRWEQLRDNVLQFIKTEAPAQSQVGVVVFDSTIINASPILPLDVDQNRNKLAENIPINVPSSNQGKRNLYLAIERGVQVLEPQGGTLVLLTQNLEEYLDPRDLVTVAANNPVWPILYPSVNSVPSEIFQDLAHISPDTSVLFVQNGIFDYGDEEYQSVDASTELHYSLLTATASPAIRVANGNCIDRNCDIRLEMNDDKTLYNSEAYVKVFCSTLDQYLGLAVKEPNGKVITGTQETTSSLFPISNLQNGEYVVNVTFSKSNVMVVAELWVTPRPLDLQVSVWSPKGLHNLPYSPGLAPRLLAKVTKSASSVLFADVTAQVKDKNNPGRTTNISLNDGGTGADVTGRDGIYSGFLVGFQPDVDVDISLIVTDNNGEARVVNVPQKAAPTSPDNVACCGSLLDVSMLQLQNPGSFAFSSSAVSGRFTGVSPGTLPPGRVTDLQASVSGRTVTLNFTAPGAVLDQGQAEWYFVNWQIAGETPQSSNISGVPAGSTVESKITLSECREVYTITVVASFDGKNGSTSNSVRQSVSCDTGPYQTTDLTAGAIAGIVIGCILGILLIVLLVYLCLNRDRLDELWVWRMLTCRCCCGKKKKDDDLYSQPSQARRTDVIRSNTTPSKPVRTLTDLYSRPSVEVKKENRQTKAQDEDDGGFGERQRRQDNIQMKPADLESLASSRSTMPINQVGLPIGSDNHAYDDSPYTIYRNAPPLPTQARANTQV